MAAKPRRSTLLTGCFAIAFRALIVLPMTLVTTFLLFKHVEAPEVCLDSVLGIDPGAYRRHGAVAGRQRRQTRKSNPKEKGDLMDVNKELAIANQLAQLALEWRRLHKARCSDKKCHIPLSMVANLAAVLGYTPAPEDGPKLIAAIAEAPRVHENAAAAAKQGPEAWAEFVKSILYSRGRPGEMELKGSSWALIRKSSGAITPLTTSEDANTRSPLTARLTLLATTATPKRCSKRNPSTLGTWGDQQSGGVRRWPPKAIGSCRRSGIARARGGRAAAGFLRVTRGCV